MRVLPGDFDDAQVQALLRFHVDAMRDSGPPETCYVLDLSALKTPDISFYVAWDGDRVVGMGALKALDATTCEIKSMRTHADHLRKGVARTVLEHLLAEARKRGYRRVSLETGTGPLFEAASSLYLRYGFVDGEAFADYAPSAYNRFMHLDL
jgi:putative acetyltransferase